MLGVTGLLPATPPAPVPDGAIPIDSAGRAALVATGLALVLAVLGRPLLLRLMGGRRHLDGPGAGAALHARRGRVLAALMWLVNPYAAACWSRPRTSGCSSWRPACACGAAPPWAWSRCRCCAVPASSALNIAGQAGYRPLDFVWALLLAVAGGQIGPVGWLFWSIAAGCVVAALVLAWRRAAGRRTTTGEARGSPCAARSRYAGPGLARRHGVGAAAMRR